MALIWIVVGVVIRVIGGELVGYLAVDGSTFPCAGQFS